MPYKIGLDRGHGGADPGAVKYAVEVELNTMLTKHLERMLGEDSNYQTILTTPYDKGLSITERTAAANAAKVDLLISNHFNAGGGDGWEIYPEVPRAQNHPRYWIYQKSNEFAKRLAALTKDIQQLRGNAGIQYRYAGADTYFGIVRLANCPAVMVENAFVDNKTDIADFDTSEEILRLAARQYIAICGHFGTGAIFDKEGKKITTAPPTPPAPKPENIYRVYVEQASFGSAGEAIAYNKKAKGIIILKE